MTARATAFVEEWIAEHVAPEDFDPADSAQVGALALECIRAGEADGISKDEIEATFEDLAAFIAGELEEAR